MARYIVLTNDPAVGMLEGMPGCYVAEDWNEARGVINEQLGLGFDVRVDCFNGDARKPEPPTLAEYKEFLEHAVEDKFDDYLY